MTQVRNSSGHTTIFSKVVLDRTSHSPFSKREKKPSKPKRIWSWKSGDVLYSVTPVGMRMARMAIQDIQELSKSFGFFQPILRISIKAI